MVLMNKMQKLTDQVPVAVAAQETVVGYEKPARARRRGEFLLHQLEHGACSALFEPATSRARDHEPELSAGRALLSCPLHTAKPLPEGSRSSLTWDGADLIHIGRQLSGII
jgi:hypothetical protein